MDKLSTFTLTILAIVLSLIAAFLWTLSTHNNVARINSFADCVGAGYPILESYPSQCHTPDGRSFVNPDEHLDMPSTGAATSSPTTPTASQYVAQGCVVGGCSAEVCSDESDGPVMSNCIYKAEFACYKSARCERQPSGQCGWTQTPELNQCLASSTQTDTSAMPQ